MFVFQQQQNLGRRFGNASKPPSGLGYSQFLGGGSVVVDSLLIVAPIVGFCSCSMFFVCYFVTILVLQSS